MAEPTEKLARPLSLIADCCRRRGAEAVCKQTSRMCGLERVHTTGFQRSRATNMDKAKMVSVFFSGICASFLAKVSLHFVYNMTVVQHRRQHERLAFAQRP